MKTTGLFILLLVSVVALCFCNAEQTPQVRGDEFFDCTGKDGYFADRYRGCHVFYRCLPDGSKWTFSCALELLFDDVMKTCREQELVYCPPP